MLEEKRCSPEPRAWPGVKGCSWCVSSPL